MNTPEAWIPGPTGGWVGVPADMDYDLFQIIIIQQRQDCFLLFVHNTDREFGAYSTLEDAQAAYADEVIWS